MALFGYFETIVSGSMKNYDSLKSVVAEGEKNWTNNVMTLLSHNIRTPIASMGNRVDIIKLKSSNGIQISKEDIDALALDRDRVNTIVHGLLSKSSRSIIAAEKSQEVSIYQTLHDYRDRVKILIPVGIDFNLGANDTIALDLALESIISNSEKYGASLVQVSLQANDKEISIQISDDGEGMDAETLKQYGTPFNSTKSKEGGTGLGVYFALQLIKEAGWRWSVESELRKGTSVTINIPKGRLVL
jgi:signal transduction histidine kinase